MANNQKEFCGDASAVAKKVELVPERSTRQDQQEKIHTNLRTVLSLYNKYAIKNL